MKRFNRLIVIILLFLIGSGCVYYNTFYHARKAFNNAESKRKKNERGMGVRQAQGDYKKAVEKSDKVIDKYPNSGWYDDALFVSGVSRYYLGEYSQSEKRFRELLANFPESQYAKESRLYLAKAKLKLGQTSEARSLFAKLFADSKERGVRAEAALALGEYYYENKDYETAREFFGSLRDSLGNDEERKKAQIYISDSYYARFKYRQAFEGYLKILDMSPTTEERYLATFQSGKCSYFLNDIEQGMEYFNSLIDDPFYYDSIGVLKLQIAEGFELDNDLVLAEEVYREVSVESEGKTPAAVANYNLGLIYQYDYEDYKKAKEYYDKAKQRGAGEDIYQDALQRSTDIGKLEEYKNRVILDSTASQAEIDSAVAMQYLLGELYLLQLDKPDSAYQEFVYIIDNFNQSYFTPKAIISASLLKRDYYGDTLGYDSMLRSVLREYPRSDFVPDVIDLLGLSGTVADTGYAEYYYHKAENFALEEKNYDSSLHYFNFIVDSLPDSKFNVQARFAVLWLTEEYNAPGDSSLYFAYADFADSFPTTELGKAADRKVTIKQSRKRGDIRDEIDRDTLPAIASRIEIPEDTLLVSDGDELVRYLTPEEKYFIDPDGNTVQEVEQGPIRTDKEFIYPAAAYTTNFEGNLYFQIKLDAFGEISDYRLMNPTPSEELNKEASEVVENSHFSTGWMEPEEYNTWFVYKYFVRLPANLK